MDHFGLDPEYSIAYTKEDGEEYVVSPGLLEELKIIKPIKKDPKHPIYIENENYNWMMDGCAIELTCKRPFSDPIDMYKVVKTSLDHLDDFVSRLRFKDYPLHVCKKPIIKIDTSLYLPLIQVSDKIYQGFIFGCDADQDVFDSHYKCETIDVTNHPYRYNGGHFHSSISGWDCFLRYYYKDLVRLMAIFVGNFCVANSTMPYEDKLRVSTYGKPGRYRFQYYSKSSLGIEYRSPSNNWTLLGEDKYVEIVEMARKAWKIFYTKDRYDLIKFYQDMTVNAITNFDQNLSKGILSEIC